MRVWIIAVLTLVCLTIVGFVFLTDRENSAWEEAQRAGTVDALENFLAHYGESEHTAAAHEALLWLKIQSDPSPGNLAAYLEEYPESARVTEVRNQLKSSLLLLTIEDLKGKGIVSSVKPSDDIVQIVLSAEESRPRGDDVYRIVLDVLASFLASPYAETFRISFPQILPERGTDCPQFRSPYVTHLELSGKMGPSLTFDGTAAIAADGQWGGVILLCEGTRLFSDFTPDVQWRNFSGNIALTCSAKEEVITAFTELPDEWIFMKTVPDFSNVEFIIPNGPGTILRFKGAVAHYFDGITIVGSEDYPLAFVLLADAGLTYLCGSGTVTDKDGRTWLFPEEESSNRT